MRRESKSRLSMVNTRKCDEAELPWTVQNFRERGMNKGGITRIEIVILIAIAGIIGAIISGKIYPQEIERPAIVEPVISGAGKFGLLAELTEIGVYEKLYLYQNEELEIHCVIFEALGKGGISCIPDRQEIR